MSNIFDLEQFKLQKDQKATREWLDRFSGALRGCSVEFPLYSQGLLTLASAFEKYLADYPTGSWWELAAIPSFGGERDADGLPLNMAVNFWAGRTGLELTEENLARLRELASLCLEPNTQESRFATHANLEPTLIYASWLRQNLLKYDTATVAVQILLFRNLLTEAYAQGFRVDTYAIEGDIFNMTLLGRTCVMRLHLDYQHVKLTGDFLESLKPADA